MKGFKDKSGKFRPTENKKGTRKSRDQTAKTEGVRMKRNGNQDLVWAESSYRGQNIKVKGHGNSWKLIVDGNVIAVANSQNEIFEKYDKINRHPEEGASHFLNPRKAREKVSLDDIISKEVNIRIENLSEDEYDDYLDDVGAEGLLSNYSYSDLLKNSDEIAYNTGYNDWLDGRIRDMERDIEIEAEDRLQEKLEEEADELVNEGSIKEKNRDDWINEKIDERLDNEIESVREEKEEELNEEAYDEYLDNLGDDVGIGNLNIGSPAIVLKEVDPTAYRVGYSDWSDGERDRIREEVEDEIDEDESKKQGEFVET